MGTQATIVVKKVEGDVKSLYTHHCGSPEVFAEVITEAIKSGNTSNDLSAALLPNGRTFSDDIEIIDRPHSFAVPHRYDLIESETGWKIVVRTAAMDLTRPDSLTGYRLLEPETDVILFEGSVPQFQHWANSYDPDSPEEYARYLELCRKIEKKDITKGSI